MSQRYSIDGQILTDMADIVRVSKGLALSSCAFNYQSSPSSKSTGEIKPHLRAGQRYKVSFTLNDASDGQYKRNNLTIRETNSNGAIIFEGYAYKDKTTEFYFTPSAEILYLNITTSGANGYINPNPTKIFFEPCDAEGNSILYFTPEQMVEVFNALPTKEELIITGNCANRFANNGWNWFINKFGELIETKEIMNAQQMFMNSTNIESIPFALNFKYTTSDNLNLTQLFYCCSKLKELPVISPVRVTSLANTFSECNNLREIPEHFYKNIDFSYISSQTSNAYVGELSNMINACYSLRKVPNELFAGGNPICAYYYSYLNNLAGRCFCLDELVNLPLYFTSEWTSNAFSNSFINCCRLKNLTFETNPDGSPKVMKWKSQTINVYDCVGYVSNSYETRVLNYNSGITADKKVIDDDTYQALKNDPDWYTMRMAYSRYNHDSAVATINSLPDTSTYLAEKGGTNTIKFQGDAGSATDGGAINTLTEEEIAVAAAKGWTVTFA